MSGQLFYRIDAATPLACDAPLPDGCTLRVWRPGRDGLPRPPLAGKVFKAWWLFDWLRLFASRDVGVLMILDGDRLVHRSLVTPRWYRFPSMGANDLQIGDTWTDPAARGRGLARLGVAAIHAEWAGRFEHMWYIVAADNLASIKVIEACGYALAGRGERTRRLGTSALGQFVLRG